MGERNSEDSRRKAAAVAAGHKRRAESGRWHGGPVPFGLQLRYVSTGEEKPVSELIASPTEAPVLRRIFSELAAGISQRRVAAQLARDGIPTRKGGEWHQAAVAQVSKNPIYVGKIKAGEVLIDGINVEVLIDADQWQRVQDLRSASARTTGHGGGRLPVLPFLLSGGCCAVTAARQWSAALRPERMSA